MNDHELTAWLGPAELTDEQRAQVAESARLIHEYYPHATDQQHQRDAALSAVVRHLLGDATPEDVAQELRDAILAVDRARAAATGAAIAMVRVDGEHKATAARVVGIDRMRLLTALGERQPRGAR
jgi:hypothetical protein